MSSKTLYSFTIYFRHPRLFGACDLFNNTTSVGIQWDTSVTVIASTIKEAMKELKIDKDEVVIVSN